MNNEINKISPGQALPAGGPPEIKLPPGASRPMMLTVILMTSFVTTFTASALNLSVPSISAEFQTGAVSVGWIVTGYILASASLSVPFGRLADLYGKRPVFICGEIIFTLCAFLCSMAQNSAMIIAFRLIQGVGSAMIFATNIAALTAIYPPEKRGTMLGFSTAVTYLGLSLGPVLGGVINQHLGWRSVFYVTTVYSVVTVAIAIRYFEPPLPEKRSARNSHIMDIPGSCLYTAGIACTMYGLSSMMSGPMPKFIFAAGCAIMFGFIIRELRTDSPVMDLRLFSGNRAFGLSNLAALLNYGASYAVGYLLSIYLQSVQGFSSQVSGLILITSPVVQTLLSPLAGRLSDRIPPYKLATFGMAITGLGIFMFVFTDTEMSTSFIVAALAMMGTGFAFFSSPNTNAIMSCVDKRNFGIASSILATSRNLGHGSSMAIVSCVITVTVGNITLASADPEAIVNAMRITFIVNTVLCGLGVACSAVRGKTGYDPADK